MNQKEGSLLVIVSIATLFTVWQSQRGAEVTSSGGGRPSHRGHGDDQNKEGLGFDLSLQLGQIQPDDETRFHFGGGLPGTSLPTNWSRHRLSYPRRQCENTEECAVTPLSHPAFPKRDTCWFYNPPADAGLGGDY